MKSMLAVINIYHSRNLLTTLEYSTSKQDIGRKSRFFFIHHLHSTPQWAPRRNIAIAFGTEKLEGYPVVKTVREYVYSFRQNTRTLRTDGPTLHDSIGRTYAGTTRQKWSLSSWLYSRRGGGALRHCSSTTSPNSTPPQLTEHAPYSAVYATRARSTTPLVTRKATQEVINLAAEHHVCCYSVLDKTFSMECVSSRF